MAFGDGVAFGVGMKLARKPPGRTAPHAPAQAVAVDDRLLELEKRMEQLEHAPAPSEPEQHLEAEPAATAMDINQQAVDALMKAVEAALKEHAGQVERQIAQLEVRIAIELKSLQQQDHALASQMTGLRTELISLHREFADAVAAIVEEQVANQTELSTEKLDQTVATRVAAETERLTQAVASAVEEKSTALRAEINARSAEITDLRDRLKNSDQNVLEVILGMGELCRQVGERLHSAPPSQPTAETPSESEAPGTGVPGFAQHTGRSILQIPLLSSIVLTAAGLVALYFL